MSNSNEGKNWNPFKTGEQLTAHKLNSVCSYIINNFVLNKDLDSTIQNYTSHFILKDSQEVVSVSSPLEFVGHIVLNDVSFPNPVSLAEANITNINSTSIVSTNLSITDGIHNNLRLLDYANNPVASLPMDAVLSKAQVEELIKTSRDHGDLNVYDPLYSYFKNDLCTIDKVVYMSKQDNNLGNDPTITNSEFWVEFATLNLSGYLTKQEASELYLVKQNFSNYFLQKRQQETLTTPINIGDSYNINVVAPYGRDALCVWVQGNLLSIGVDYTENESLEHNVLSISFLKSFELDANGKLEIICKVLPFGELAISKTIQDTTPSTLTTYSSTKIEQLLTLFKNFFLSSSILNKNWYTLTKETLINKWYKDISNVVNENWVSLNVIGLVTNDIWCAKETDFTNAPFRKFVAYIGETSLVGYLYSWNQEEVTLRTSETNYENLVLVFNKTKQAFKLLANQNFKLYSLVIYTRSNANNNTDSENKIIDDTKTSILSTWSSSNISTKFTELYNNIQSTMNTLEVNLFDTKNKLTVLDTTIKNSNETITTLDANVKDNSTTIAGLISKIDELTKKVETLSNKKIILFYRNTISVFVCKQNFDEFIQKYKETFNIDLVEGTDYVLPIRPDGHGFEFGTLLHVDPRYIGGPSGPEHSGLGHSLGVTGLISESNLPRVNIQGPNYVPVDVSTAFLDFKYWTANIGLSRSYCPSSKQYPIPAMTYVDSSTSLCHIEGHSKRNSFYTFDIPPHSHTASFRFPELSIGRSYSDQYRFIPFGYGVFFVQWKIDIYQVEGGGN